MSNTALRETALATGRLSQLKTNERRTPEAAKPSGISEIKRHLRTRWAEVFKEGFSSHDLLAGITVATVAIPLNVALAIAAGLPASAGLLSGAIGGFFAAAFGGSNYQATGPSAALNVIVFALVAKFGYGGAAGAALIAGISALAFGLMGYGKLGNFVPSYVLAGFTTGVGLTLLNQQVPMLTGSELALWHILTNFWAMEWLREISWLSVVCGIFVAWVTVGLGHLKSFPSSLLGILVAAFIAFELSWDVPRVGEISLSDMALRFPQLAEGTEWWGLLIAAIPLIILPSAESLLSAKAVDELSQGKSGLSNTTELFGQGIANLASGLVGGMPVSGAVVRSSVNLQAGARTRVAAMMHGVIQLGAAWFLGKWIGIIPVAALAGLLVVIAWRLIRIREFITLFQTNKIHALAFAVAAIGTVTGNLMLGLGSAAVIVYLEYWVRKRVTKPNRAQIRPSPQIRAVVSAEGTPDLAHDVSVREQAVWHRQIRTRPRIHPSAFVHPTASIIGWVEVGREVNVAADTSLRADEGAPFYIGDRANVQDGVVIHALKEKWVKVDGRQWAVYIGENVSLAHQALVHGPCLIGKNSFIGFKAVVHDSIVGEGCFIGMGAIVVGVEIPPGKRVPNGWVVDTADKIRELPDAEDSHAHFNEDVVEVNRGLAAAYAQQPEHLGASNRYADAEAQPGNSSAPASPSSSVHLRQVFKLRSF